MTKITEALALYRSMVRGGENESPESVRAFEDAMEEARQIGVRQKVPVDDALCIAFKEAINRYSAENGSDTPDYILAEYLTGCLVNFDRTFRARKKWYERNMASDVPPSSEVAGALLISRDLVSFLQTIEASLVTGGLLRSGAMTSEGDDGEGTREASLPTGIRQRLNALIELCRESDVAGCEDPNPSPPPTDEMRSVWMVDRNEKDPVEEMDSPIFILFSGDGPCLAFVEVEDEHGHGIGVGEWVDVVRNGATYRALKLTPRSILRAFDVTIRQVDSNTLTPDTHDPSA